MRKVEKVYSQIKNKGKDANDQPFWSECYHEEDVTDEMLSSEKQWYCYYVKFDGATPIQLTKVVKLSKTIN